MMKNISVVLAAYNEEENLTACLESVKKLANEIVIVDGGSEDRTLEIAKKYHARIISTSNPPIFHLNKQKALEAAKNEWILQLDADEIVSEKLAKEIEMVTKMSDQEIEKYQQKLPRRELFLRHQKIIEARDGKIGTGSLNYTAFFIPRLNYFLGKFLKFGGVYPDGVIRLVRYGKAYFPCQSVHEQIVVCGRVGWLNNDLIHMADPNLKRYLNRNSKYIGLMVAEMKEDNLSRGLLQMMNFFLIKPIWWFFKTSIIHKGVLDGTAGIIFSFFSALRFPRAYFRYLTFSSIK